MAETPTPLATPTPAAVPASGVGVSSPEPAPPAAPAVTVVPEPVAAAPVAATVPEPAPVVLPVADPLPAAAPEPPPEAAAVPEPKPTLLQTLEEKPKPADKPPEATPLPEGAEVAPVVYQPFSFPEGIKADDSVLGELSNLFGSAKVPQDVAQKIIDTGTKAMGDYAAHIAAEQHRIFNETRAGWVKEVMSDAVLGGVGHQTAMGAVARMRDLLVPPEDRAAWDQMLTYTGAGDHPALIRMLHHAAQIFDEPAPLGTTPRPTGTDGGKPPRGGIRSLYDHPSSAKARNGA